MKVFTGRVLKHREILVSAKMDLIATFIAGKSNVNFAADRKKWCNL